MKARTWIIGVSIGLVLSWGCVSDGRSRSDVPSVPPFEGPAAASGVSFAPASWAYMLQGNAAAALGSSTFKAVVTDYSKDGTQAGAYTAADVAAMKAGGRTVLAYLSIGEAESYRYYFDPAWLGAKPPAWLGNENPDWPGNYKVLYWSADWQDLVYAYLDKIVAAGFDGVYLDIVDAYWHWADPENGEGLVIGEALAAERMISFIARIAARARATDADFLVVPQNAEEILDFDTSDHYLDSMDGIGIEDLFYDERTPTSAATRTYRRGFLDSLHGSGKAVIVVDYAWAGAADTTVNDFRSLCSDASFVPYAAVSDRALDEIVVFTGQGE